MGTGGPFSSEMRPGREADKSPSSTEVRVSATVNLRPLYAFSERTGTLLQISVINFACILLLFSDLDKILYRRGTQNIIVGFVKIGFQSQNVLRGVLSFAVNKTLCTTTYG